MSAIRIAEASAAQLARWDEDVERAVNGTIFHLRSFLAYHGDRFSGLERHLVALDHDQLIAQIPVVVADGPGGRGLRSPYGGSYGSVVFQRRPTFAEAAGIVAALLAWCESEAVVQVTLTPPIAACSAHGLDVVTFALLHAGFRSINRDITSIVPLDPLTSPHESVQSRARQNARKAERNGVTVHPRDGLAPFWEVMEATFDKHGASPTHTLEEFRWLADRLPDRVYADVAYHDGEAVAGIGYFVVNRLVLSTFYLCQRPDRRDLNGMTLCVMTGLERAWREGYRWLDLGTSSAGVQPRENIFRFKEQFASVGQFRETLEWRAKG
jgi:hypothetical protein